jgi:hypothetical protein
LEPARGLSECGKQAHGKLEVIKDVRKRNKPPTAASVTGCQGTPPPQRPLPALTADKPGSPAVSPLCGDLERCPRPRLPLHSQDQASKGQGVWPDHSNPPPRQREVLDLERASHASSRKPQSPPNYGPRWGGEGSHATLLCGGEWGSTASKMFRFSSFAKQLNPCLFST